MAVYYSGFYQLIYIKKNLSAISMCSLFIIIKLDFINKFLNLLYKAILFYQEREQHKKIRSAVVTMKVAFYDSCIAVKRILVKMLVSLVFFLCQSNC